MRLCSRPSLRGGYSFSGGAAYCSLRAVEGALARYTAEVEGAGLKPSTAHTHLHHARAFVRWLKGGFAPGATLPREGPRGAPPRPPA